MNIIITALFVSILLHFEFNLSFRIKRALKIKPTKTIKFLDCFPCFTFWTGVAIVLITRDFNIINLMAIFVIASIYDKWN